MNNRLKKYLACAAALALAAAGSWIVLRLGWKFDAFSAKHWAKLARLASDGNVGIRSASMLCAMAGFASMATGVVMVAMEKFQDVAPAEEQALDSSYVPIPEPAPEPAKSYSPAYSQEHARQPDAAYASSPAPAAAARYAPMPPMAPPDAAPRTASAPPSAPAASVPAAVAPAREVEPDYDLERAALQEKIRSVMAKMKRPGADAPKPALQPPPEFEDDDDGERHTPILTPVKFGPEPKGKIDMHFPAIPQELNEQIERAFIAAGCKLLSEIRIGSTGVDYMAVADDAIHILQADESEGTWLANEDEDSGGAKWFSEDGAKPSPAARAADARNAVAGLLSGRVDLPIKAYAYIAKSEILNTEDMLEKWADMDVRVINPEQFAELFAPASKKEPDSATMQIIIPTLEEAEAPA